jgi:hypothetical protein
MPTETKLTVTGRVVLVVLTIWALVMIVPDLYRIYDPLASFGFSADNDGVVTGVSGPFPEGVESPAARAGIRPGDRIDLRAMRCIPIETPRCRSLVVILGGWGGAHSVLPKTEVELVLLPAAGTGEGTRIVRLVAATPLRNWTADLVGIADGILGIAVILTLAQLVWTRPGRMIWGLFLYIVWFNPGQTYAYYALLQPWPGAVFGQEVAESIAVAVGFAGLIVFALRFPHDRLDPVWIPLMRALPWLVAILSALNLASFGTAFGYPSETVTEAAFLAGLVVNAAVLGILMVRRQSLPPQDAQRMRWVVWGCAIGLPAFIFASISQSASLLSDFWRGPPPSEEVLGLFFLINGVLVYFVSEAVRQRRVINVSIPLRHGLILAVLAVIAAVPFAYAHDTVSRLPEMLHIPEWVWLLTVGPVVLVVMERLHEIAAHLADHVFNYGFHRATDEFDRAGQKLLQTGSIAEIDRLLVEVPVETFALASAAVFRLEDGALRRQEAGTGWKAAMVAELTEPRDGMLLQAFATGRPVRLLRGGWEGPDHPTGLAAPTLAVPVRSNAGRTLAVALYGPHETGNDLNPDERDMLGRFAEKAAAGYERVEMQMLREEVAALKARLAGGGSAMSEGGKPDRSGGSS